MQIAAAYEVLADDEKRKLYDQVHDAVVQDLCVRWVCSSLSRPADIVLCLFSTVKRDCGQLEQMGVQVGLEGAFLVEDSDSRLVLQASKEAATATSCTLTSPFAVCSHHCILVSICLTYFDALQMEVEQAKD